MDQFKDDDWFKKLDIKPEEALKAADANGDGQISYQEFLRAIQPEGPGVGGGSDDEEKDSENDAPFSSAAGLGNALEEIGSQSNLLKDQTKAAAQAAAGKDKK